MRILIVANGYPEPRDPQWGCFEKDQALALKAYGHEVSIMFVDRRFRKYWRRIGITKRKDSSLDVYGMFYFPMRWLLLLSYPVYKKFLIRLYYLLYKKYEKDQGKPDVIYAHYIWNMAYSSLIRKKEHIPLVGIEHWSGLTKDVLSPKELDLGTLAYSSSDCLLSVSKSLKSHIKRHFDKESTVVYDMLGLEFMKTLPLQKNKQDGFRFITVGSLLPIKGFDVLIQAFAQSGLYAKGCTLSIIGDGPERHKLETLVNDLELSRSVFLLGKLSKDDIVVLLSQSNVYVMSSYAETFGVACIEGLSQGLPAIVTKCGGPEDYINEKNGILVETNNASEMAEAMKTIFNQYSQYDRESIAENCRSRFAPDVIAKQLSEYMGGAVSCLSQ